MAIVLDGSGLTIEKLVKIARHNEPVELDPQALKRMEKCRAMLEKKIAARAAQLCKADLVTNLVVEMTSLQGTIGKYYALRDRENRSTAQAIEDHYLPRKAGGSPPKSRPA